MILSYDLGSLQKLGKKNQGVAHCVYRVVSFRTRKVFQDKGRFGKNNMFLAKQWNY